MAVPAAKAARPPPKFGFPARPPPAAGAVAPARPPPPPAPIPLRLAIPIPRISSGPTRTRLELFNSIFIPVTGTFPLADIAEYAFQHYALFVWLVTHPQPRYLDGPDDSEISEMINKANKTVSSLENNGPSAIWLAVRGGYTREPFNNQAVERMVLLALMAERPQLLPKIFRVFPETSDPIRLSALLKPYLDSHVERYEDSYSSSGPKNSSGITATLPPAGILKAIAAIARVRLMHNLMLRDMIRARYAMVTIMADPYVFGTSSLGEIKSLITKIDTTLASNASLYIPLVPAINTLKSNMTKVESVVSMGAAVTQDALRRLRLILGVVNSTDTLFDKMAKGQV